MMAAVLAFGIGPLMGFVFSRLEHVPLLSRGFYFRWAVGASGSLIAQLLTGTRLEVWAAAASLAVALILWLWSRRKQIRRALRALGDKTRAVFAAMARNMPRPGPVLRPVPQGAR